MAEQTDGLPDGMSDDARETWPHPSLIGDFLGDAEIDFEFRPGEDVVVHDDPAAREAARTSRAWPLIHRSGRFCVNILSADQEDVSAQMATKGVDKFAGIEWTPAEVTGSPVIAGTIAHLDCTIHTVHEAGDHFVVIGRV